MSTATALVSGLIRSDTVQIFAPKPITSDAQNERCIAALLWFERQPRLSAEQKQYAELLTLLVVAYEDKHYPIPAKVVRPKIMAHFRKSVEKNRMLLKRLADY